MERTSFSETSISQREITFFLCALFAFHLCNIAGWKVCPIVFQFSCQERLHVVFCFTSQVSRRSVSSLPTTFRFFHFPDAFFWFPDRFPHGCWKLQIPIPTANANTHPFPSTNACTGNGFFRVHWLCQNRLKWGVWFQTPKEYEVVMNSSLELWNNYVILLIYIFLFLTHYIRLTVRLTFSKSSVKMTNSLKTVGAQGL